MQISYWANPGNMSQLCSYLNSHIQTNKHWKCKIRSVILEILASIQYECRTKSNTCELESFHGFLHNMTIVFVFIFYILIQLLFSFLHVVQPRTVIACHPSFRPSFSPTSLLSSIKLKGERHIVSMWSIKKLTISVVFLLQIHA